MDLLIALDKWRDTNPLYKFRRSMELGQKQMAALLGCSLTSIRLWEQGAARPSEDSMEAIQRTTGIARTEFESWFASRPTLEA